MKPFGVYFWGDDKRPYRERRQDLMKSMRTQMDPIEAEKQERRLLRMMKNGVTRAQFGEMDVSMERVEAVARKYGFDLKRNTDTGWRTPPNKLSATQRIAKARRAAGAKR